MRRLSLTDAELAEAERLRHEELVARARSGNVLAYRLLTKPDYQVAWHHRVMARQLTRFVRREISRLMIFVPPQHGKSDLVSRAMPPLIHGLYPNDKILAASYNASLQEDMTTDVQRILDSDAHREIFPLARITPPDSSSNYKRTRSEHELIPVLDDKTETLLIRPEGSLRGNGVSGSFTGKPGDWLIIDDPYKNRAEADSPAIRKQVQDNYVSSLRTRLKGRGQILLMHTRWFPTDLAGYLLDLAKSDPEADQWEVLKLPAILEREDQRSPGDPRAIGDALWPERFPIDTIRSMKALGSRDFQALYQQEPTSAEGAVIKRAWIKTYDSRPSRIDQMIQSWDCTFKDSKGSDWVVGQVWGKTGADKYLLDQFRARVDIVDTMRAIRALTAKWPKATLKLIEEAANGAAIIQLLKREIPGLVPVKPKDSKLARLNAVAPEFESGNVWVPSPSIAPWVGDWLEEVVSFPQVPHDDQVDAMTQALARLGDGNARSLLDRLNKM